MAGGARGGMRARSARRAPVPRGAREELGRERKEEGGREKKLEFSWIQVL